LRLLHTIFRNRLANSEIPATALLRARWLVRWDVQAERNRNTAEGKRKSSLCIGKLGKSGIVMMRREPSRRDTVHCRGAETYNFFS
jgi:hypothetical protein